ncbi:uncharacterized protein LOC135483946 [Lineus longissimus]|uniref:uncharacterized protein LOC135483946 n=1 Tax=Lineus longissimus TaxID=88925 RepID=UPI00315CD29F
MESYLKEKAAQLRRSLGQLKGRVTRKARVLEEGVPVMTAAQIEVAQDELTDAMVRYGDQHENFCKIASDEERGEASAVYFEVGQQVKFNLDVGERQKAYLLRQRNAQRTGEVVRPKQKEQSYVPIPNQVGGSLKMKVATHKSLPKVSQGKVTAREEIENAKRQLQMLEERTARLKIEELEREIVHKEHEMKALEVKRKTVKCKPVELCPEANAFVPQCSPALRDTSGYRANGAVKIEKGGDWSNQSPMVAAQGNMYQSPMVAAQGSRYQSPMVAAQGNMYQSPMAAAQGSKYQSPMADAHSDSYQSPMVNPYNDVYPSQRVDAYDNMYRSPMVAPQSDTIWNPMVAAQNDRHQEPMVATQDGSQFLAIAKTLEKITSHAELPPPEPIKFDGTASEYVKFKRSFDLRVGGKNFSEGFKLAQLLQLTQGNAHKAISLCDGAIDGYQKALGILNDRFGRPYQIVKSCIEKVTNGERINRNSKEMLAFSDQLTSAYDTLCDQDLLKEADTQMTLKAIFDRFPVALQERWVRKVISLEDEGKFPRLADMVQFVKVQARTSTHVVFEVTPPARTTTNIVKQHHDKVKRDQAATQKPKVTTLSTQLEKPRNSANYTGARKSGNKAGVNAATEDMPYKRICRFCKAEDHGIWACSNFEKEDLDARRRFVRNNRLCYCCLGRHMVRSCTRKKKCPKCDQDHHVLLHLEKTSKPPKKEDIGSLQSVKPKSMVLLKVIPVRIAAQNGESTTTLALLDSGSSATLMTRKLAAKIGIEGEPETISINTVLASGKEQEVSICECTLQPIGTDEPSIPVNRANIVEELHIDRKYHPNTLDLSDWEHLKELDLSTQVDEESVSILIGEDVPRAHMVLESCYGTEPHVQPYAVRTPLAWCVAGPIHEESAKGVEINLLAVAEKAEDTEVINQCCRTDEVDDEVVAGKSEVEMNQLEQHNQKLEEAVSSLWQTEKHGFINEDVKMMSFEDRKALHLLDTRTKLVNGHYEIGLLWRSEPPALVDNRMVAAKRLEYLRKRFVKEPAFAEMYCKAMGVYFDNDYARVMTDEEAASVSAKTWYLPHHGVANENKPGKLRVVFDAAASFKGTSLNQELLQGPDQSNSLIGVLLRFREHQIAVTADVEAMFLRFKVPPVDCQALRFLWWRNGLDEHPVTCQMTSHIFGATDSPSACTYGMRKCAEDFGSQFDQRVVDAVTRSFYVDDFLQSVAEVSVCIMLSIQMICLLSKGSLKLTKFMSNSPEVMAALPGEVKASGFVNLSLESTATERALGVRWNVGKDSLGLQVSGISKCGAKSNTRRECLAAVSSIYDPLGFVGPVTLVAKRILQMSCKQRLAWDDELPEELMKAWEGWKATLPALTQISLPRWYFTSEMEGRYELHHFADASEGGYGTVSYLRKVYDTEEGDEVECAFVMAKTRTAPLQFVSIPRLELQAAVVAVRMDGLLRRELDLPVDESFYWTDSKITLSYVCSENRRFKTYVANRVAEIRDSSTPSQWRHIPGKENPADEASRGQTVAAFLKNERWFAGPEFLSKPGASWSTLATEEVMDVDKNDPEVKTEKIIATLTEPATNGLSQLISRSSSWTALRRRVAVLLKFVSYLQSKKKDSGVQFEKKITPSDLDEASKAIMRCIQREVYARDIDAIRKKDGVSSSSSLASLNPLLVDGVLRVGGRISRAPISFDSKHPMIVPKGHHAGTLLIAHFHEATAHAGQEHVLSRIRQTFWLVNARREVRKILKRCIGCRKRNAIRMNQLMADLPAVRLVTYEPPFTNTGVDYFGPMLIKAGRSSVKRWGVLFTCLNVRAVHLEISNSMDLSSFLNAFRRFSGRRGDPKQVWSDNGTNFVGGERELREAIMGWNQEQIQKELCQRGTEWHFQPPLAPHMSGVWESLVKSVKRGLKAVLGDRMVSDEVLVTTHVEVEKIVNSRPICRASDDPDDEEVLTPNHFLLQRGSLTLPPGVFFDTDLYHRKQWRKVQMLANQFWQRWIREYLPTLQKRTKWVRRRRNAEVGDLVLVTDDMLVRGHWPMGVIIKTFAGEDGAVRVVEVKTSSSTVLRRPIHKLCMLEESCSGTGDVDNERDTKDEELR